jgi:hypothetical protein
VRDIKAIVILLALVGSAHASTKIRPSTSLQEQTSNNTSAANAFVTQTNGNLGASNVSKVNIRTLLYPGATSKIYVHLMPWFGSGHHMDVGYSSNSAAQVHKQVVDMISRGIEGAMIDWYGPGSFSDQTTKLVMGEAERHPGFTFAIVVDKGALKNLCSTCTVQQELTKQLQYVAATYFSSPAYMRFNGQPVITNFDLDHYYTIDWNALAAVVPGSPAYIFQHDSGFTHPLSSGSYSWVGHNSPMTYLSSFYGTSSKYPNEATIGSVFKGFNDTLASWTLNRVLSQRCGQMWLDTFAAINRSHSANQQLDAAQLVTWNDYEEGTELESGIDNCLNISASLSGKTLVWRVQGDESTLDHYAVYVSTDGQNLMPLDEISVGNRTLNLASYPLDPGKYLFYVQAVGKPSIVNHISAAVAYNVTASSGGPPASASPSPPQNPPAPVHNPGLTVGVTPSLLVLRRGSGATLKMTIQSRGTLSNVQLSCANASSDLRCRFSNVRLSVDQRQADADLTIMAAVKSDTAPPVSIAGLVGMPLAGLGLSGLVLLGDARARWRVLITGSVLVLLMLCSCGGTAASAPVLVNANSGSLHASATVRVTVF